MQLTLFFHEDSPACQARLLHETNCIISPVRLIKKWEDTLRFFIVLKYGCTLILRELEKKSSIYVFPNLFGGRLILWITNNEISSSEGRASWFGEWICLTLFRKPSELMQNKFLKVS